MIRSSLEHYTVTFKYDPFGRRIYKSSSAGTSVFAYDGDNLVEEMNSYGTAAARYAGGLNIDEPLAMHGRRTPAAPSTPNSCAAAPRGTPCSSRNLGPRFK